MRTGIINIEKLEDMGNIGLENYFKNYKERLFKLIESVNVKDLEKVINALIKCFNNGNTLYVCGNGGSAATASHIYADFSFFVRYFTKFRPVVRALTDNVPLITAVGNDTSFRDIFTEQLKGNFRNGDLLLCISASGNSENLIRATKYANDLGGITIAFIGFDGGELLKISKLSLFTPNPKKDYGPIEDLHMIYDHLIINYLSQNKEFLAIPEEK